MSRREDEDLRILTDTPRTTYIATRIKNEVSLSDDKELFVNNNSQRWADEEIKRARERERGRESFNRYISPREGRRVHLATKTQNDVSCRMDEERHVWTLRAQWGSLEKKFQIFKRILRVFDL